MFVHSECTRRYMYSNIIMMIGSLKRALRERILGLMQEKKIASELYENQFAKGPFF